MARKKIVFVIVEGPSDAEALDTIIERLLDKDTVHVHIVHGDLTTENGVTSSNIINRVVDEVRSYTSSNPFTKNDFKGSEHMVFSGDLNRDLEQIKELLKNDNTIIYRTFENKTAPNLKKTH